MIIKFSVLDEKNLEIPPPLDLHDPDSLLLIATFQWKLRRELLSVIYCHNNAL